MRLALLCHGWGWLCSSKQQVTKDQEGPSTSLKMKPKQKTKSTPGCDLHRLQRVGEVPVRVLAQDDRILLNFLELIKGHTPLESSLQGCMLSEQMVLGPGQQGGVEVYQSRHTSPQLSKVTEVTAAWHRSWHYSANRRYHPKVQALLLGDLLRKCEVVGALEE